MKKQLLILTCTLLTLTAPTARAADPYFSLCTDIQKARSQVHAPGFFKTLWDVVRTKFAPGSVVTLQETRIATTEFVTPALPLQTAGENIIFSIEPPGDVVASPDFSAMQTRYAALTATMKRESSNLVTLLKTKSVAECVARARKINYDYGAYLKLAAEYQSLHVVRQFEDAKTARQNAMKALGQVKLHWTYFAATDLGTVFQALRTRSVRNVVIISHGMTGGKLVDSRLSEYPLSFFSEFAPNLESITIFACHGDETVGNYKIVNRLKAFPSYHPQRMVIVSKGTTIFGVADSVPMAAFPSFMKKVDARIRKLRRDSANGLSLAAHAEQKPALCETRIHGLVITRGMLGVVLNGRFIGAVDALDAPNPRFQFPCSIISGPTNIMVLKNLSLLETATPASLNLLVDVSFPGREISEPTLTHYFKPATHLYQSSKITFALKDTESLRDFFR